MKRFEFRRVFHVPVIGDPNPPRPTGQYTWYTFDASTGKEFGNCCEDLLSAIADAKRFALEHPTT